MFLSLTLLIYKYKKIFVISELLLFFAVVHYLLKLNSTISFTEVHPMMSKSSSKDKSSLGSKRQTGRPKGKDKGKNKWTDDSVYFLTFYLQPCTDGRILFCWANFIFSSISWLNVECSSKPRTPARFARVFLTCRSCSSSSSTFIHCLTLAMSNSARRNFSQE